MVVCLYNSSNSTNSSSSSRAVMMERGTGERSIASVVNHFLINRGQ